MPVFVFAPEAAQALSKLSTTDIPGIKAQEMRRVFAVASLTKIFILEKGHRKYFR
jgi:hypothetical protein